MALFSAVFAPPLGASGSMAAESGTAAEREIVIVGFGDSLTAGYGLAPGEAFPDQLERALRAKGYNVRLVNAGVSGDIAANGLARLEWSIPEKADAVIVEFGANDALRGLPPAPTKAALDAILSKLKSRNLEVLLAGMMAPPNMGLAYIEEFNAIYPALAAKYDALLYPFFLEGVAGDPRLNFPDGLHPTAEGIAVIVKNILPSVEQLVARVRSKAAEPR